MADRSADPGPLIARPSQRVTEAPTRRLRWTESVGWLALGLAVVGYVVAAVVGIGSPMGLIVVVVVIGASAWWFPRLERARPDLALAGLLRLSLGLKLMATLPRYLGREDAVDYHRFGSVLADSFRSLDFAVDTGQQVPGTGSVRYMAGLVQVVTLGDEFATFVVFSVAGFVGMVWFVKAFLVALPEIDPRRYALLLLLWPSLLYWPSSTGKDAVMVAALGATALGVAGVLRGRILSLVPVAAGLTLAALVRPHVALIAVIAAVGALTLRGSTAGSGDRAGAWLRVAVVVGLLIGGSAAADSVEQAFGIDGLDASGVSAALDLADSRSSQGGSSFAAARVDSPVDYPWAAVTVLFRPFPQETASVPMLVTAMESVLLLFLTLGAVPRVLAAFPNIRREAYVGYALASVAVFVYLFSALGNFGILARQRTMIVPLLLVLVGLPTARERVRMRRMGSS